MLKRFAASGLQAMAGRSGRAFCLQRSVFSELRPQLVPGDKAATADSLERLVAENQVVLFMKGSPDQPQCGYSRLASALLQHYNVKRFIYVNVSDDAELKEAVKQFSDWPTFPQLYLNGALLGGADILMEMHKSNELGDKLKEFVETGSKL